MKTLSQHRSLLWVGLLVMPTTTFAFSDSAADSQVVVKVVAQIDTIKDPSGILSCTNVKLGDKITLVYTYDASVSDSDSDPEWGEYIFLGQQASAIVSLNGAIAKSLPIKNYASKDYAYTSILNSSPWEGIDQYVFRYARMSSFSCGAQLGVVGFNLFDMSGQAFSDDSLPSSAPSLSEMSSYPSYAFGISAKNDDGSILYDVSGHVLSVDSIK